MIAFCVAFWSREQREQAGTTGGQVQPSAVQVSESQAGAMCVMVFQRVEAAAERGSGGRVSWACTDYLTFWMARRRLLAGGAGNDRQAGRVVD